MLFELRLTENSVGRDLERLIDRITRPGNRQIRSIQGAVRQSFQEQFTRQSSGNGPWPALAPRTVQERQRLGFPGRRPILVRTGALRSSFVNSGDSDHYSSVRQSPLGLLVEEGSENEYAIHHERGGPHLPQRSVTLMGESGERRIFDVVELMIGQLEREVVGR